MRTLLAVICLLSSGSSAARAEAPYTPEDPEPTADEVRLLELINRFRADPAAEAARVREDPGAHGVFRVKLVDWDRFTEELKAAKPAPPLVMDLRLVLAARRHAFYIQANRTRGHAEQSAGSGFSGVKMPQRVTEAGYVWSAWYENVYVGQDPWDVHAGFVVDFARESPDGMLPGRGHRAAMLRTTVREAGMGIFPRARDDVFVEGFGDRKDAVRLCGGVVFEDRDGDRFYDVGEGVAGVTVEVSGGAKTRVWKSGGFALDLGTTDAVTVTFRRGDETVTHEVPAGADNVKLDWILPARQGPAQ